MQLPRIHVNGTSREELVYRYETALAATRLALNMIGDAAPHGRDYSDLGFTVASVEHVERLHKIEEVISELEKLLESVS